MKLSNKVHAFILSKVSVQPNIVVGIVEYMEQFNDTWREAVEHLYTQPHLRYMLGLSKYDMLEIETGCKGSVKPYTLTFEEHIDRVAMKVEGWHDWKRYR